MDIEQVIINLKYSLSEYRMKKTQLVQHTYSKTKIIRSETYLGKC